MRQRLFRTVRIINLMASGGSISDGDSPSIRGTSLQSSLALGMSVPVSINFPARLQEMTANTKMTKTIHLVVLFIRPPAYDFTPAQGNIVLKVFGADHENGNQSRTSGDTSLSEMQIKGRAYRRQKRAPMRERRVQTCLSDPRRHSGNAGRRGASSN